MNVEQAASIQKSASRTARTLRSLLYISLLGAVLIAWSTYGHRRDVSLATGPKSDAQRSFLIEAADRPDIATFFKKLKHEQRMAMAQSIGRYPEPALAKLTVKLLGDFDEEARRELTRSLSAIAVAHPNAVAAELSQKGSFQQLGMFRALQAAGDAAVPIVAEKLAVADARPNAAAFLVTVGRPAVPHVLPLLEHEDKDTRLTAADVLGKLRAQEAVQPLVQKLSRAAPDERLAFMSSIAAIAAPETEGQLVSWLRDESLPTQSRAQAALGLGRIGSSAAVQVLWSFASAFETDLRRAAISALQLAGEEALAIEGVDKDVLLKVASGIDGPASDRVIAQAMADRDRRVRAAQSAQGRERLTPVLRREVTGLDPFTEGDYADALIGALISTPEGRAVVEDLRGDKELAGLIERRLSLTRL